jgi:hypothetical protein
MIKDKLFFFKELTLTTFYGDAICFEACSVDVLKNSEGTRGSKRGALGPSTGENRASIKKVNYRWQTKA